MIQEKFVETKFGRICYLEGGEGANTVVKFHGLFGGAGFFNEFGPSFKKAGFRLIVPYLPGHGKSFVFPKDFSYDDFVAAMKEFWEKVVGQKKGKKYVIGGSFGGGIAIALANSGVRIDKIILVNPLLFPVEDVYVNFFKLLGDYASDKFRGFFADEDKLPKYNWEVKKFEVDLTQIGTLIRITRGVDLGKKGKPIPTLLLLGEQDSVIDREKVEKVLAGWNYELKTFPGHHHWTVFQNRDYLNVMLSFLKG